LAHCAIDGPLEHPDRAIETATGSNSKAPVWRTAESGRSRAATLRRFGV